MQTIKVSSLLFNDLDYSVPATIEEYNALAPKRQNPVLEDAVDNIMKHKVLSQFRNNFLDFVEEKFKVARVNNGTEKTPKWEADMPYMNRIVVEVLKSRGENPSDAASVKALVAELTADAQRVLSEVKFNVEERERTATAPSVAKTHTEWAKQAVESGKADALLGLLNRALGTTDTLTGDAEKDIATLAKAISANEKRKRDLQAAAAKSGNLEALVG